MIHRGGGGGGSKSDQLPNYPIIHGGNIFMLPKNAKSRNTVVNSKLFSKHNKRKETVEWVITHPPNQSNI